MIGAAGEAARRLARRKLALLGAPRESAAGDETPATVGMVAPALGGRGPHGGENLVHAPRRGGRPPEASAPAGRGQPGGASPPTAASIAVQRADDPAATGEAARRAPGAGLDPEKVAERVYALLGRDLRLERERLGSER